MASSSFFGWIAILYYLCSGLLVALTLFILLVGRQSHRRRRLTYLFASLALCLLSWQVTLFLEVRSSSPALQLWLGRLNFAAMVVAPYLCLSFIRELARAAKTAVKSHHWLRAETALLALITLFTPAVDAAETVTGGEAITTFGPLFPLYLLHVLGLWGAALVLALRERGLALHRPLRDQLALVGGGIAITGGIALVTNALLPYLMNDFRFCELGALSTLFFLLAIAYATLVLRLFNLRIFVRQTLVYGLLLTGVLGVYSSTLFVVTQLMTEGADKWTQFAVLLIAFSFDPLRRFLEKKTDEWLFPESKESPLAQSKPQRRRHGRRLTLALLFPWRR
jgi:hypothetical protein